MKRPDLLILIAVWEFITAFFAFVSIAFTTTFIIFFAHSDLDNWRYYWGYNNNRVVWNNTDIPRVSIIICFSVVILILLCYMVLAIISGIGLIKGKEWGRISGLVHSAISIVAAPVIGTVIGILSIIYLVKPEVKEYFTPTPKV